MSLRKLQSSETPKVYKWLVNNVRPKKGSTTIAEKTITEYNNLINRVYFPDNPIDIKTRIKDYLAEEGLSPPAHIPYQTKVSASEFKALSDRVDLLEELVNLHFNGDS